MNQKRKSAGLILPPKLYDTLVNLTFIIPLLTSLYLALVQAWAEILPFDPHSARVAATGAALTAFFAGITKYSKVNHQNESLNNKKGK